MDVTAVLAAADAAASAEAHVIEMPPTVPGLTMHLDGDYLAYYAAGNDETTSGEARLNAINIITSMRNKSGAEKVVVHTTGKGSSKGERYLIATVKPYQAQRAGSRKPVNHEYLRNWLQGYDGDLFQAKVWANREADDGMAYLAEWSATHHPLGYCVIATADKDMRMLPGLHITWKEHDLVRVMPSDYEVQVSYRHLKAGEAVDDTKIYGTKWFWLQMLMGDAADNIPGLEKFVEYNGKHKPVGEKTAELILRPCSTFTEAAETVFEHYCRYYNQLVPGSGPDRFVEQALLLWLRRDRNAELNDFINWSGVAEYLPGVEAAFHRLEERVHADRRTLIQIAS